MGQYVVLEHNERFFFNLCDSNGHVLASSIVFPSRDECLHTIAELQKDASAAQLEDSSVDPHAIIDGAKYRIYEDMDGTYYFRYFMADSQDVLQSRSYNAKDELLQRIERMRKESTSSLANEV